MNLPTISTVLAFAVAAALTYAVLLMSGRWVAANRPRYREFLTTLANDPADRLWRQLHRLGRQRSVLLNSVLVFIITATCLTLAEPKAPQLLASRSLQIAVTGISLLLAGTAIYHAVMMTRARHELRSRIDANLSIARALDKVTMARSRVFHDVPTTAGTLDHVIVSLQGIYAISVIARRPAANAENRLTLKAGAIRFAGTDGIAALEELRKQARQLARECGQLVQHDVRVRHVIAVPGWDIESQPDDSLLIANEHNIAMLTGWKNEREYLMDEDLTVLVDHLDGLCSRPV